MLYKVSETSAEKEQKQNDCLIRAEHLFYSYDEAKAALSMMFHWKSTPAGRLPFLEPMAPENLRSFSV